TRFSRDWSSDVCSSDLRGRWSGIGRHAGPPMRQTIRERHKKTAQVSAAHDNRQHFAVIATAGDRCGDVGADAEKTCLTCATYAADGAGVSMLRQNQTSRATRLGTLLVAFARSANSDQRFENWKLRRALTRPYFFRSTVRLS